MAFKHIKYSMNEINTDESLYTVPTGKEFIWTRTRACCRHQTLSADVTFKKGTETIVSLTSVPANGYALGNPIQEVLNAGTIIKVSSTRSSLLAEVMGLEFPAGTWSTIGGGEQGGSSSSSSEPAEQSSSSEGGTSDTFKIEAPSTESYRGTYKNTGEFNNGKPVYGNGDTAATSTYFLFYGGTAWSIGTYVNVPPPGGYNPNASQQSNSDTPIGDYYMTGSVWTAKVTAA